LFYFSFVSALRACETTLNQIESRCGLSANQQLTHSSHVFKA